MNARWIDPVNDSPPTVSAMGADVLEDSTTLSGPRYLLVDFEVWRWSIYAMVYGKAFAAQKMFEQGHPLHLAIRILVFGGLPPHDPNNHTGRHFHEPSRRAR